MSAVLVESRGLLVPVEGNVLSCLRVTFLCKAELVDMDGTCGISAVVNSNWVQYLQFWLLLAWFPSLQNLELPWDLSHRQWSQCRSLPAAFYRSPIVPPTFPISQLDPCQVCMGTFPISDALGFLYFGPQWDAFAGLCPLHLTTVCPFLSLPSSPIAVLNRKSFYQFSESGS